MALILFSDSETASKLYDLHLNHALNRYEGHYMHLSLKSKCDGLSLVYIGVCYVHNQQREELQRASIQDV